MRGRVRRLRAGLVTPRPGGSGTPPARHYDRAARCSLDWDRPKPGNARRSHVPGSAGLELSARPCAAQRAANPTPLGAPEGAAILAKDRPQKDWLRLPALRPPRFFAKSEETEPAPRRFGPAQFAPKRAATWPKGHLQTCTQKYRAARRRTYARKTKARQTQAARPELFPRPSRRAGARAAGGVLAAVVLAGLRPQTLPARAGLRARIERLFQPLLAAAARTDEDFHPRRHRGERRRAFDARDRGRDRARAGALARHAGAANRRRKRQARRRNRQLPRRNRSRPRPRRRIASPRRAPGPRVRVL